MILKERFYSFFRRNESFLTDQRSVPLKPTGRSFKWNTSKRTWLSCIIQRFICKTERKDVYSYNFSYRISSDRQTFNKSSTVKILKKEHLMRMINSPLHCKEFTWTSAAQTTSWTSTSPQHTKRMQRRNLRSHR